MNSDFAGALDIQAGFCAGAGAALYGGLLPKLAEDVLAGGPTAALTAPWAGADRRRLLVDAVALRLVGALHDLVLSGDDPDLALAFAAGDGEAAWPAAEAALARHADRVAAFMSHEPQTNEVGRSGALLGGFLTVAKETGLPLRTFELGASAGLNQNWDRFGYRLGEAAWGAADARPLLTPEWTGGLPPLEARVEVPSRAACDRRPVDIADPVEQRRLMAYVWPDQPERLERLAQAIDVALAAGTRVEKADAAEFAGRISPEAGAATVIYHSVFWQYMPAETQAATRAAIEAAGARASAAAPFAWLSMEPDPANPASSMLITLMTWPGGEARVLAHAHPHGATVRWLA